MTHTIGITLPDRNVVVIISIALVFLMKYMTLKIT